MCENIRCIIQDLRTQKRGLSERLREQFERLPQRGGTFDKMAQRNRSSLR